MLPLIKSLALVQRWGFGGQESRSVRRPALPAQRYFWLGLSLFLALLTVQATGWRWHLLTALQGDNVYKQVTGFSLLAFILYQWRFSVRRAQGGTCNGNAMVKRHKLIGAMAPLLFFGHSQALGYGYLEILSLTFLLVFMTGLCNVEIVKVHKPWFQPLWITVHVGLSMALLFLLSYHAYLSYAFK